MLEHVLQGGTLTITAPRRIETANVAQIEADALALASEQEGTPLAIDASALEYISSAGLRVLLKLAKMQKGAKLPVQNVSPDVYEIFETTGFTTILDVQKRLREISVEGCELIGSGGYGKVYRIDDETIAKIYNPQIPLSFVEQERATSQKAFLLGVPTAISFDVVKCGGCYGVVYELLNARTVAQIMSADRSKVAEMGQKCAALLKELHTIKVEKNSTFPSRKEKLKDWVKSLAAYLTQEESNKIIAFIDSIPDRDTFLHGDFNSKNIMIKDGEFQLIDIGDAAYGHPVFDLAMLMLAYIILPQTTARSVEEREQLMGFALEDAEVMWASLSGAYFGISDAQEIGALTQKLMPYCLLMMAFQAVTTAGDDESTIQPRIDHVFRKVLFPAIEHAAPVDF